MGIEDKIPGVVQEFTSLFDVISGYVNETATRNGFWEGEGCTVGEKLMLMVSEIAEALEAQRDGSPLSEKIPPFSGMEEELADLVIRAMDFAYHHNMRLAEAILAKIDYNDTRPYKHGRKNF